MNSLIKILAIQAGATVGERSGWTDYGTLSLDVEEFAELIIKECANIVRDCNDRRIPLSMVANYVEQFKRLENE